MTGVGEPPSGVHERHDAEGQALLAAHPQLAAWLARMDARPSMLATTMQRLMAA